MAEDEIPAFLIDPDNIPEQTSKDKLMVKFKEERPFAPGSKNIVWHYQVLNFTKVEKGLPNYESHVQIWRTGVGYFGTACDCPARKQCKHIIEAIGVHQIALDAGFIQENV